MITVTHKSSFSSSDVVTNILSRQDAIEFLNAMTPSFGNSVYDYKYFVEIDEQAKFHLLAKCNMSCELFPKSYYEHKLSKEQLVMILLVYVDIWSKLEFFSYAQEYTKFSSVLSRRFSYPNEEQHKAIHDAKVLKFKRACEIAVIQFFHYEHFLDIQKARTLSYPYSHILSDNVMLELRKLETRMYKRNQRLVDKFEECIFYNYRVETVKL